jgi:hypothetical protein
VAILEHVISAILEKNLFWVVSECIVFAVERFVTIKAIALKLCIHVPLGKSNSQTKFQSSLILGLAIEYF